LAIISKCYNGYVVVSTNLIVSSTRQLRPKVNNYALTVAKGDGYDLNRSLFERLVINGYPHSTLKAQHRMRPEISKLVKELSYPDLQDAEKTRGRPDIRGLLDNVVMITHSKPEDDDKRLEERRDGGAKSSKQNRYVCKSKLFTPVLLTT
jgi:hypothetical protein